LTTLPYTELRSIMSLESVAKNLRDADAPGVATATLTLHCVPLSMTDYLFDCNLVLHKMARVFDVSVEDLVEIVQK
jgi:hypothetical protein